MGEMRMKMMLDTLWNDLEAEAQRTSNTGILKRMLVPSVVCTMFLGIQCSSLNRLFMLQIPRSLLPSREQIPESRGFDLNVYSMGEETDATFLLSTSESIFNEVFSAMVENLYQNLKECLDERQIVHIFLECLLKWQAFFEKNTVNGLSEEVQRGLYGELYFLKEHLLSSPEYFLSEIAGWTGSKNRQHDFQFGDLAVEVKTCCARQHQKLLITGEQQLDEILVGDLFVFHLSLSIIENHISSLPALVAGIRNKLCHNFAAASIFESRLLERGYLNAQAWRYQTTGYTVREENMFHVIGEFPRITERDIPHGVGDLTYSVSVSECKKFTIPLNEVITHIHKNIL